MTSGGAIRRGNGAWRHGRGGGVVNEREWSHRRRLSEALRCQRDDIASLNFRLRRFTSRNAVTHPQCCFARRRRHCIVRDCSNLNPKSTAENAMQTPAALRCCTDDTDKLTVSTKQGLLEYRLEQGDFEATKQCAAKYRLTLAMPT